MSNQCVLMDPNTDTVRSVAELLKHDREYHNGDTYFNTEEGDGNSGSNLKAFAANYATNDSQSSDGVLTSEEVKVTTEEPPQEIKLRFKARKWKKPREYKLKLFVFFLFVIIVSSVTVIFHFYKKQLYLAELGQTIKFDERDRILSVQNVHKATVLQGKVGKNLPTYQLPYDCSVDKTRQQELCLLWRDQASLYIDYYRDGSANCYSVAWEALVESASPHDCYILRGAHWYGGALTRNQRWPIAGRNTSQAAFVSGTLHDTGPFGPVLERYWLSSSGVAIFVERDSPLHVSFNVTPHQDGGGDEQLCLYSHFSASPYRNTKDQLPYLNYTICVDENVLAVHKFVLGTLLTAPTQHVNVSVLQFPMWSTFPYLGNNLTEAEVVQFAENIVDKGYLPPRSSSQGKNFSSFIIEDKWEATLGNLDFDKNRFPNPRSLLDDLHHKGFATSLKVHPLISTDSDVYHEFVVKHKLLRDAGDKAPGLAPYWTGPSNNKWFQGYQAVLDMDQDTAQGFTQRLLSLKRKYGFDSFRFGAGQVTSLPYRAVFKECLSNPNDYSAKYVALASDFGNKVQVQVGGHSQSNTAFIQVTGQYSDWGYSRNGLKTVIPVILTLGILGYPFIIPDVVGGNQYDTTATQELYIRWMELSAFLPIMHFSVPPDVYNQQVQNTAKRLIELHADVVFPEIMRVFGDSSNHLIPIVRPLWWIEPDTEEAFTIEDEFLVGNNLLVAPVLTMGKNYRDIYLPKGTWLAAIDGTYHKGPLWLRNVPVALHDIAYFTLQSEQWNRAHKVV